MDKRIIKNIYFCIILPAFVGSLSGLGIFILVFKTWIFGLPLLIFLSCMLSSFVGFIIRSIYKWEEPKGKKK